MLGLHPKVAVNHLVDKKDARPIKQTEWCFRPKLVPVIEIEVNNLIKANFIHEVKYPTWISRIVLVNKKNGQILISNDFMDLNKACPRMNLSFHPKTRNWCYY